MRLFLASNVLGNYPDKLVELVGENRKVLVISNARDHRTPEDRKVIVKHDMDIIRTCGLEPLELDLKNYIGKSDELRAYIDTFAPGCIFVMGGNYYSLATTFKLSGMDKILLSDLAEDKYVYAGYSAGAMVTAPDLMNYFSSYGSRDGNRMEEARAIYGEVYTDGLGVVDFYVLPHIDEEKFRESYEKAASELSGKDLKTAALKNSDVILIQDKNTTFLS